MTEEKRYYTPTEGEFRVGFDYEEFVKGEGWMPRTLSSLSEDPTLNQQGFCIDFPDDFRVKCLDKEDIEAEGWKSVEIPVDELSSFCVAQYKIEKGKFTFFARVLTDGRIYIWGVNDGTFLMAGAMFIGQILNRSELKFQMKRLGIV